MGTQANKAALERIAPFEVAIKRPYFHVKPLDQAQLTNWWAYLDNKIKSGSSHAAIVRLFERCLVPCAAYSGERCSEKSFVILCRWWKSNYYVWLVGLIGSLA